MQYNTGASEKVESIEKSVYTYHQPLAGLSHLAGFRLGFQLLSWKIYIAIHLAFTTDYNVSIEYDFTMNDR